MACAPGATPGAGSAVPAAKAGAWSGRIVTAVNGGVQLYEPGKSQPTTVFEPTGTQFAQAAVFDKDGPGYLVAMTIIGTGGQAGNATVGNIVRLLPGDARGTTLISHEKSGEILLNPSWSGQRILAGSTFPIIVNGRYIDQGNEVLSFDASGGDRKRIVDSGIEPNGIAAGQPIAYTALDPKTYEQAIALLDPASGMARVVVANDLGFSFVRGPALAPDGKRLLFTASGGPGVSPAPTFVPTPRSSLGPLDALVAALAPRPAAAHGAPQDIWMLDIDSNRLTRITERLYDDPNVSWSPDGKQAAIVYSGGLQIVEIDSKRLTSVSDRAGMGSVAWAP